MTTTDFERQISEAFSGGEILRRELRLTAEEAGYVRSHYPAELAELGGSWYEITFKRGRFHE